MATYCIGDLHGRFDLFQLLLEKIAFDPSQDKLYVLGDVIDRNYGGIQILQYIMTHKHSCYLIEGNHESQFIYMYSAYDIIMFNPSIKAAMTDAVNVYSDPLFTAISEPFLNTFRKRNPELFYKNSSIKKWLKSGDSKVRQKLLNAMIKLAASMDYDETIYQKIEWILSNLRGQFKTKPFVQELLEQPTDVYIEIKDYLKELPSSYEFEYNNTHFTLSHWKGQINKNVSYKIQFPHATTQNTTYIFGHDPIPMLHSKIQNNSNNFAFDYRQIFSWMDTDQNRYYWLDLGSNPVAAIKLDDMSEYYVGIPSTRKNAKPWTVPTNTFPVPGKSFCYIESASLCGIPSIKTAIITTDNGCYEFLIGITEKNQIFYTHIGWLECQQSFPIDRLYTNQPIDEIIEYIHQDFSKIIASQEYRFVYNVLHGIKLPPSNSNDSSA